MRKSEYQKLKVMNELEKKDPQEEVKAAAETQDAVSAPEVCAESEVEECKETESPAEAVSEMTDAVQPGEQPIAAGEEEAHNFHNMRKDELVAALRDVLDNDKMESHRDVTAMKQAFFSLRSRERLAELNAYVEAGNDPAAFVAQPDDLENEFNDMFAQFKERRQAYIAADDARRQANLEQKLELLDKMNAIAGDIDTVNVKFQEFQQLQADFRAIKDVPPTAETELWKNFQTVSEQFYDHLKMNKELRDLDFKKNLEAKKALLAEARKLAEVNDPVQAFRTLQGLHDEWRNIGPVAKDIRESLWEEFREASAVVNRRHQDYFEQRKASEQINEAAKEELCKQIEELNPAENTTFAQWNAMTDQIIQLQKKWKEYGYASKKANTALYTRFRRACDNFFEAKTEFFRRTREGFSENLAKKIALCERAEALKDNTDIKNPTDEIVKLQAEWKTIGSVPRKQSDEVWARFTTACNYFFDERKRQNRERRKDENSNLDAKRAIIAELKELPLDGDRREVIGKVKELQAKWNEIGFVPFKYKDSIFKEYREICDTLYNTYTERESNRRMNNWQDRMGRMRNDNKQVMSERDKLVRALESRKNDLLTYENNLGFFNVKSSAGNSMVKELERKIGRLKDEIEEIKLKIRMVDNPELAGQSVAAAEETSVEETPKTEE